MSKESFYHNVKKIERENKQQDYIIYKLNHLL